MSIPIAPQTPDTIRPAFEQRLATAMSEKQLQERILRTARAVGWLAFHVYDSRRSAPGFPDLVLVHPHRAELLFAELKTERGRLTREQRTWLDALGTVEDRLTDLDPGTGSAHPPITVHQWRPRHLFDGTIDHALGIGR